MTADPVRIGVLGCADIARRRVVPAFAADPGSRVVAFASRAPANARALAERYGCRAAPGYQALLDDPEVEAVYVPLPVALHAEWIERALLAGKHVLGEKPLSCSPETTEALFALAEMRGLVLAENFMFPFHHQHARVRELVASGAIGEPRSFTGEFTIPPPAPGNIRYRRELGGGALFDIAVHPLLAAVLQLGPGLTVRGAALHRHPAHGVDDGGSVLLATPEGVTAQIVFGMDHGYRSAYELCGSEGRLLVPRAYAPPADHRPVLRIERATGVEELPLDADDQYLGAVSAFSRAVHRARTHHPADDQAGRRDLSLTLARLVAHVPAVDEAASSASGEPADTRNDPKEVL
ncbi:NDP-hexose-3-ketoreductase [Streptacidiphilus sp. MAP12-33]|uniref:Gfo/Idh/MocA family protein n=1 Tax=Streptacidiphilus sp. MAP12-33 TaxID=3156266 RepID=UPI0035162C0F